MLESGSSGSVRGASRNGRPYREPRPEAPFDPSPMNGRFVASCGRRSKSSHAAGPTDPAIKLRTRTFRVVQKSSHVRCRLLNQAARKFEHSGNTTRLRPVRRTFHAVSKQLRLDIHFRQAG
jgi:hypothetical protein